MTYSKKLVDKFNFYMSQCSFTQFLREWGYKKVAIYVKQDSGIDLPLLWSAFYRDFDIKLVGIYSDEPFNIEMPVAHHFAKNYSVKKFYIEKIQQNVFLIDFVNVAHKAITGVRHWVFSATLVHYFEYYIVEQLNKIEKIPI